MEGQKRNENLTVHGLPECLCGCGRIVPKGKNRNKIVRRFFSDQCRMDYDRQSRRIGRTIRDRGIRPENVIIQDRQVMEVRKKQQEQIDLDSIMPRARLRLLCRAAETFGVMHGR